MKLKEEITGLEAQESKKTLLVDLDDTIWEMLPHWISYTNFKY